jgi:hypothetical protein
MRKHACCLLPSRCGWEVQWLLTSETGLGTQVIWIPSPFVRARTHLVGNRHLQLGPCRSRSSISHIHPYIGRLGLVFSSPTAILRKLRLAASVTLHPDLQVGICLVPGHRRATLHGRYGRFLSASVKEAEEYQAGSTYAVSLREDAADASKSCCRRAAAAIAVSRTNERLQRCKAMPPLAPHRIGCSILQANQNQ